MRKQKTRKTHSKSIKKIEILETLEKQLREEIIFTLTKQGFKITKNYEIVPNGFSKEDLKKVHYIRKLELLKKNKQFLEKNIDIIEKYAISGSELDVENIDIELRVVKTKKETILFRWWNLSWWSLPYERPIGRQIRYLLWDRYHNTVFGLVQLQSPVLHSSIRDEYLELKKEDKDYWLNQSMYAQRVGAIPPYNYLLGGKLVAMSLASKDIREIYENKYKDRVTFIRNRKLPARLLFITTTSAYGKGTIYERLKYNGKNLSIFIGYTKGSGTFHIPDELYEKLLKYLRLLGINTKRGYGTGPSRKLRLISRAFYELGFKSNNGKTFIYHNIKRGCYLFPHAKNLKEVIKNNVEPEYYNYTFREFYEYWYKRWLIPRSERNLEWKKFNLNDYINDVLNQINDAKKEIYTSLDKVSELT
ncbi:conserved protein of unknown function [Methanocaldococcus lauensis]|uniref:DUF4338 domain-containing protein n=1 Tax=Methanocaldococcus lauensis TaxID=2546128 RepID=A0A8D6PTJ3_9EURY|nr:Druantia anti-phage system protein DruA [Methanocaldococcus lauensis]CAB3287244.1 conserved protein of unknown function [Methanocaldococcus lauensis]